jgi:hypothetical protein
MEGGARESGGPLSTEADGIMNRRSIQRTVAAALLFLFAGGCGPLVNANGKLTHKGQPVPSTLITFLPDDGGRASHGLTDDNGDFKVTYSRTETGITRGSFTVVLRYIVSNEEELHQIQPKASTELKAVIAKYADPKTSGLRVEITKGGQFIPIALP